MDQRHVDVLKSSLLFWLSLYAAWLFSGRILACVLPALVTLAVLLLGVLVLRIPRPDRRRVTAILGRDPAAADDGTYCMKVVGHRGAGLDAPENTLAAFQNCADKGCDAVEFDVSLTCDDVAVILHDNNLSRLADSKQEVRATRWQELSQVDIAIKHPLRERFPYVRIARLDETIELCLRLNIRMFIDVKDYDIKMTNTILETFEKNQVLYDRAVVCSFNPIFLYKVRRANPKIVCCMTYRPYICAYSSYDGVNGAGPRRSANLLRHLCLRALDAVWGQLYLLAAYMFGAPALLLHKDIINPDTLRRLRERGLRVVAWTVNQPAEKQYFAKCLKVTYMTDTLIGETSVHNTSA